MVIDAIKSGAADFIVKPFQADRIIKAVRKLPAEEDNYLGGVGTYISLIFSVIGIIVVLAL
jgi:ActR/RegA family two-component response regulator